MKLRPLIVGGLSLAMLCATGGAASAQSSGCANVSISIRTGTATVAPGTTIGIAGGVNNCSSRRDRYTVVVSAMSSCGQRADIATVRMALNPGENTIYGVSYVLPAGTCAGAWQATAEVRDGSVGGSQLRQSGSMASASTTIMVE